MPPKKLQPKRKKHKAAGSSSGQQRHLLSTLEYAQERKDRLINLPLLNHQYLDWGLLQEYGMEERIKQAVKDKTWFKLFALREPAFKDITIEFLSTVQVKKDTHYPHMTFQAYGEIHTIELNQMGFFLGFYEESEPENPLPISWPENMTAETFWNQIIHPKVADFVPSKSLATMFNAVENKLLHHILAHTICCKKTSHSKVTSFDMFYLYSMISGHHTDVGVEVANFFARHVDDTRMQFIFCGGYITALLKGMGIFQRPDDDEGISCKPISAGPFLSWGLRKIAHSLDPAATAGVHELPPAEGASSSFPPPVHDYEQLRADIREVKEEIKAERKKNKKFRTTLVNMLKSAISCLNPAAAEEIHYETSMEESSEEEEDQEI